MCYLAVHFNMLGMAHGSWDSFVSLVRLRNPLIPRGEGFMAEEVLLRYPRLRDGNKFLPKGSRQRCFPSQSNSSENSKCLMGTSHKF